MTNFFALQCKRLYENYLLTYGMFDNSESLLAKLLCSSLVDIDHLVSKAKETGFAYGDIDLYSRMYKRKIFNHYYSRVKKLA